MIYGIVYGLIVLTVLIAGFYGPSQRLSARKYKEYCKALETAEKEDLAYYLAHTDCSWEDAHRHREAIRKKYRL